MHNYVKKMSPDLEKIHILVHPGWSYFAHDKCFIDKYINKIEESDCTIILYPTFDNNTKRQILDIELRKLIPIRNNKGMIESELDTYAIDSDINSTCDYVNASIILWYLHTRVASHVSRIKRKFRKKLKSKNKKMSGKRNVYSSIRKKLLTEPKYRNSVIDALIKYSNRVKVFKFDQGVEPHTRELIYNIKQKCEDKNWKFPKVIHYNMANIFIARDTIKSLIQESYNRNNESYFKEIILYGEWHNQCVTLLQNAIEEQNIASATIMPELSVYNNSLKDCDNPSQYMFVADSSNYEDVIIEL